MSESAPILTLEPLLEGIEKGVRAAGWTMSGVQKTTSHQFEGRWDGESTRSAYLFFHHERYPEDVGIDVFLDETSRGLSGNLALVVDLAPLADLGEVRSALSALARLGVEGLPAHPRVPVSLRFRLADGRDPVGDADSQLRLKVRIPASAITEGAAAIERFAADVTRGFEAVLDSGGLEPYMAAG